MANVNLQGNNPSSQSVAQQSGTQESSGGGSATFRAGLSAVTISALLAIMEDMMKLAILNGDMMINEVNTQKDLGNKLCEFNKSMGDQMCAEYMAQGFTTIGAGVATIGAAGVASKMTQPDIDNAEANLNGAKSYKEMANESKASLKMSDLDELPSPRVNDEVDKQVTDRLEELKAQKNFTVKDNQGKTEAVKADKYKKEGCDFSDKEVISMLDGDELTDLNTSLDENIESSTKARTEAVQRQNAQMQHYSTMAQAAGNVATGSGQAAAGVFKKEEQDLQGQVSAGNSALTIAQGVSSQTRTNVDKYMGEVGSLTQIMAGISKANQLGN